VLQMRLNQCRWCLLCHQMAKTELRHDY